MIDLAIALALERAGFGVYGDTIFWNVSPLLQTGTVSENYGIRMKSPSQPDTRTNYSRASRSCTSLTG